MLIFSCILLEDLVECYLLPKFHSSNGNTVSEIFVKCFNKHAYEKFDLKFDLGPRSNIKAGRTAGFLGQAGKFHACTQVAFSCTPLCPTEGSPKPC